MKKLILLLFCCACLLVASGLSFAQDRIPDGTYVLDDGNMQMAIKVEFMPDGRYIIEGQGKNKDGNACALMGSAKMENGTLFVDYCPIEVVISAGKLEIKDTKPCAQCDPGAYISGIYKIK